MISNRKRSETKHVRERSSVSNANTERKDQSSKKRNSLQIDPNLIQYHWYLFEEPSFTDSPGPGSASSSSSPNKEENFTTTTSSPTSIIPAPVVGVPPQLPTHYGSYSSSYPDSGYGYGNFASSFTLPQTQDDFGWNYSLEEPYHPHYEKKSPMLIFRKLFNMLGPILFPIPFILAMIPFLIPIIPLTLLSHYSPTPPGQLPDPRPNNSIIYVPDDNSKPTTPPATFPTETPAPPTMETDTPTTTRTTTSKTPSSVKPMTPNESTSSESSSSSSGSTTSTTAKPSQPPGQKPPTLPPGHKPPTLPPGHKPPTLPPGQKPPTLPPGQKPPTLPPGQKPPTLPPGQTPPTLPPGQKPPTLPPGQTPPTQPNPFPPGGGGGQLPMLPLPPLPLFPNITINRISSTQGYPGLQNTIPIVNKIANKPHSTPPKTTISFVYHPPPQQPPKLKEDNYDHDPNDYKQILFNFNFPPTKNNLGVISDLWSTFPLLFLNDTFDYIYDRKKSRF